MITLSANLIAIALYAAATLFFVRKFWRQEAIPQTQVLTVAALSLVFHGIGVLSLSLDNDGFHLSLFAVLSLVFWVVNGIVLISSFKKELHNLFLLLFPLSALSVLASVFTEDSEALDYNLASHIILSILAYSLLTIASLQALLVAYQNRALKHKNLITSTRLLPPLQTMESLLFELLWAGEIFLTLAIASGFWFLEDMFAQDLAHKTIFALTAWFIYALLLWGRHRMGWRGNTAIRWTLAGFVCLMLAYFGSKIVLELLLNRV